MSKKTKDDRICIQIGDTHLSLNTSQIPPIGTLIMIHKHLTDDGSSWTVEVIDHEWRIEDANEDGAPFVSITVKTKKVRAT